MNMDGKESLADIVAELRRCAERYAEKPDEKFLVTSLSEAMHYRSVADRIEAAAARERKPNPCFYPDTDCQFRMMDGKCCNPCVRLGIECLEGRKLCVAVLNKMKELEQK